MTRRKRIALELLGPPLLGATLIMSAWAGVTLWTVAMEEMTWKWDAQILVWMLVVLVCAYFLAGIPSIVYMLVMEWRFARGLNPGSWRAVKLSTLLGTIAGAAIAMVLGGGRWQPEGSFLFGGIGLMVGFLLGWLIKVRSTKRKDAESAQS